MHHNLTNKQTNRLLFIQILRVAACILVFLVHFGQRLELTSFIRQITNFGEYGVQLFFIISGYLAAYGLSDKKNISIKKYYIKKAIRILPLYYLVIAYYFVSENILNQFVHHIPVDTAGLGWFRYLFLLNGFIDNDTYFWSNLGITWTIPIFIFFYLIAPFLFKWIIDLKTAIIALLLFGIVGYGSQIFIVSDVLINLPYLLF